MRSVLRTLAGSLALYASVTFTLLGVPRHASGQVSLLAREPQLGASDANGVEVPIVTPEATEVLSTGRDIFEPRVAAVPLEEPLDPDQYICGAGDTFELRFWGRQNMTVHITVDYEGKIFVPKVGTVDVAGKTLNETRTKVLAAVRRFYPGLSVGLSLTAPREFVVHVVGDVKNPGTYISNPRQRLNRLMQLAGGATGSLRRIEIHHKNGKVTVADLLLYVRTGETRLNPYLLDGDVVKVPQAEVMVKIDGAVTHPGRYELIETKDLAELLQLAGGLTSDTARTLPIRLIRRDESERRFQMELGFLAGGKAPNAKLQDDDVIAVPDTSEVAQTVLLVGAVVGASEADQATSVKRMRFVKGDTVRRLVDRAGGVTAAADLKNSYVRSADGKTLEPVDMEALMVRRDFSKDKSVRIGDTIVIPFKRQGVVIEGAVMRGGIYPFNPNFKIREYLAVAGGRTRMAQDLDDVRVVSAEGSVRGYSTKAQVNPGDTIIIPERDFSRSEVVQLIMSGAGILLSAVALGFAASR